MSGTLYGIGVGPGDPELVTLKAVRLIQECPVIAYPAPEDGPSLARHIVAWHLTRGAKEIAIRMPMDESRYPAQAVYDRAALAIGGELEAGRNVAVLCQGDPFFYGSFMYLFERLAETFPVEIVPGVSSLGACAAALKHPLVSRNDVLTVIPATLPEDEIRERLSVTDAAAIMKIGRHFEKVRRILTDMGLAGNARYVERASMPEQAIRPLDELLPGEAPYFAMILVHMRGSALR